VLEIEKETERKWSKNYVTVNLLIDLATKKPRDFPELPKHGKQFTPNSADFNRPKTVKSNVMRNTVSKFSNSMEPYLRHELLFMTNWQTYIQMT
jgi:hypothetical protein